MSSVRIFFLPLPICEYGLGSTFSINEIVTPEENYKLVKYECINNNNDDEDSSFLFYYLIIIYNNIIINNKSSAAAARIVFSSMR